MRREIHSNHRLVITPDARDVLPRGHHDATVRLLNEMTAAIQRHVDHVDRVAVTWDTEAVCSHCNREWETVTADDLANYADAYMGCLLNEPVCCGLAAEEFRAEQAPDTTGGA